MSGQNKMVFWVALVVVLLGLTSPGEGVKQEMWWHLKGGNALYFDKPVADLSKYESILPEVYQVCVVGTWLTYMETDYEHYFEAFGLGGYPTCNPTDNMFKVKSIRHYASNETDNDALSIYAGTMYNGTEIYVTARAYTGITERMGSVAAGGHTAWMLYEGQNLDGASVCFDAPKDGGALFHYNRLVFINTDMTTIGSVFKGCDEQEIQAYKKLHSL